MQALTRLVRKGHQRDRGAVAVVVAIVIVPVLLSMAALVIDAGSVYLGRQNAQNGADAAALALANACAKGQSTCTTDIGGSKLNPLVQANVSPGSASLDAQPCIQKAGVLCQASSLSSLPECAYPVPTGVNGVQVRTRADIDLSFPWIWNHSQEQPKACASAAWGPPKTTGINTLPFSMSACEWFNGTSDGTNYAPSPPYSTANPMPASFEKAIVLNQSSSLAPSACATWQGHDFPGGFGWLTHTAAPACQAIVDTNGWVGADTGVGAGNDCGAKINGLVGQVVYLPVFDCMSLTKTFCNNTYSGTNTNYHVQALAAFFVTAVDVTGQVKNSLAGYPKVSCPSGQKCMYGWFVKDVGDGDVGPPGGPDYGLVNVQAVG